MEPTTEMRAVIDNIAKIYSPQRIYLYNRRVGMHNNTTSFKLCVILDTPDKSRSEQNIYLNIDSEIPFDVLVYTPQEWEALSSDSASFAGRIKKNGVIVHE